MGFHSDGRCVKHWKPGMCLHSLVLQPLEFRGSALMNCFLEVGNESSAGKYNNSERKDPLHLSGKVTWCFAAGGRRRPCVTGHMLDFLMSIFRIHRHYVSVDFYQSGLSHLNQVVLFKATLFMYPESQITMSQLGCDNVSEYHIICPLTLDSLEVKLHTNTKI